MCGINGCLGGDSQDMLTMNAAIAHRGPDDQGWWTGAGVALGHVRLSILDLSPRGHQPMPDHDGRLMIVFNGEIYNFMTLRRALEDAGVAFRTETDTEVILEAFAREGAASFAGLNGIFAFALVDIVARRLYLVRDRLGIKPLLLATFDGRLAFSSELAALAALAGRPLTRVRDREAEYLDGHDFPSDSPYEEVAELPPGCWLEVDLDTGARTIHRFATLTESVHPSTAASLARMSDRQLADALDELLTTTISDQLVADAPVGTICSGGLDSSLVTAIAARLKPDLHVFNVRVGDPRLDESPHARRVAALLGLQLHDVLLDRDTYAAAVDEALHAEGVPLSHANSVGILLMSRAAKAAGISVLLSGEGADELFGGYHRYKAYAKRQRADRVPILGRWIADRVGRWHDDPDLRRLATPPAATGAEPEWLARRRARWAEFHAAFAHVSPASDRDLKAFIAKDLLDYLPAILRRTDRMSMAAGLEMRVPFLDNRLVEFALNLPVSAQVTPGTGKRLLKLVAERYLPRDLVHRHKMGFPLPAAEWLGVSTIRAGLHDRWLKLQVDSACASST